jgi:ribosomal protein L31E
MRRQFNYAIAEKGIDNIPSRIKVTPLLFIAKRFLP